VLETMNANIATDADARTTARTAQTTPADFGAADLVARNSEAGTLVFEKVSEPVPSEKLIGFGADMDPEAMTVELRKRGLGHGAVGKLPVFEM